MRKTGKKMTDKMDLKNAAFGFVAVVFLLLGVLFGMQIMTFIFGSFGTVTDTLDRVTVTVANETGWINSSGYLLSGSTSAGFSSVSISIATNATDARVINAANFTVSNLGLVTNLTSENWNATNFTYTYNQDSEAKITSDAVTNNSLGSVVAYTNQSNTQMNTAAIAITLLILIAIFAIFWRIFMSKGGISGGSSDKNFS